MFLQWPPGPGQLFLMQHWMSLAGTRKLGLVEEDRRMLETWGCRSDEGLCPSKKKKKNTRGGSNEENGGQIRFFEKVDNPPKKANGYDPTRVWSPRGWKRMKPPPELTSRTKPCEGHVGAAVLDVLTCAVQLGNSSQRSLGITFG